MIPYDVLLTELTFQVFGMCYYRPQRSCGKVMFSQASVILFTWGEGWRGKEGRDMRGRRDGHCSGRPASYWNAFLVESYIYLAKINRTWLYNDHKSHSPTSNIKLTKSKRQEDPGSIPTGGNFFYNFFSFLRKPLLIIFPTLCNTGKVHYLKKYFITSNCRKIWFI